MMSRHAYFQEMKRLAREKRDQFNIDTAAFGLREMRAVYKAEAIRIDYWPLPKKIRGLYMCADDDFSVAVQRTLPNEPKLFTLVHELKHHYVDRDALGNGVIHCGDYNANELIEIGAEVFAAEFIYPEAEFDSDIQSLGIAKWNIDDVVRFKHELCRAKVSYTYIRKRLERLGHISRGQFDGVKFQNREEEIYGTPFYKQAWFRNRRRSSTRA